MDIEEYRQSIELSKLNRKKDRRLTIGIWLCIIALCSVCIVGGIHVQYYISELSKTEYICVDKEYVKDIDLWKTTFESIGTGERISCLVLSEDFDIDKLKDAKLLVKKQFKQGDDFLFFGAKLVVINRVDSE